MRAIFKIPGRYLSGLDELSASIVLVLVVAVAFVALGAFCVGETEPPAASSWSQTELHGPLTQLGQPPRLSTPTPSPTPTPAPEPTPVPTPPPPPEPTREVLIALVRDTFPNDPRMSGHVVWNETLKLDDWWDYVYGGTWSETDDCGLMQINWYWHHEKFAAHGWTEADCFDPAKNLVIAREIYDDSGCGAWSTC